MIRRRRPARDGRSRTMRRERDELVAQLAALRAERLELEVEVEAIRYTRQLLGKERGADPDNLTNAGKTRLVLHPAGMFAMRPGDLWGRFGLSRSTFYHNRRRPDRPGRDEGSGRTSHGRVQAKPGTLRLQAHMADAARAGHPRVRQTRHAGHERAWHHVQVPL